MSFVVQFFSGTIGELKLRIKFRMLVFQLFEGDTSLGYCSGKAQIGEVELLTNCFR